MATQDQAFEPARRADPEAARRAAVLHHEMSKAPVGSKQRRFLRRAAERARARARASAPVPPGRPQR
jgi:hypothetical protein